MSSEEPTRPTAGTPEAEVTPDEALVLQLLRSQHADLAALPIRQLASGWDNVSFRLGEELVVRLPRRSVAADLIRSEQRWLPELGREAQTPIPVPVRVGEPGEGYPWPWSIVPYFEGEMAAVVPLHPREASTFGTFLAGVHQPAPANAPENRYRGVPLRDRRESVLERLDRIEQFERAQADASSYATETADLEEVRSVFEQALSIEADAPAVWLHGDLHPKNIVVSRGRLAAVIDWGDLTSGDPATDLAALWMLFPHHAHDQFWQAYGDASPALKGRARGWAVFFGVVLLDTGLADDPVFARIGRQTLWRTVR